MRVEVGRGCLLFSLFSLRVEGKEYHIVKTTFEDVSLPTAVQCCLGLYTHLSCPGLYFTPSLLSVTEPGPTAYIMQV